MALLKNAAYKNIPFSKATAQDDCYTYMQVEDLASKCEDCKHSIVKCRTVGILSSNCGIYYLEPLNRKSQTAIRVSMSYLQAPPPSSVIRNPVQMFGELMWKGQPVLYARIIQILSATMALRLNASLSEVATLHKAIALRDIEDT